MNAQSEVLDSLDGCWNRSEPVQDHFRYKLNPGPTSTDIFPGASLSAVDLFNRFFTNEVWELLVVETNRYAALSSNAPGTRSWHDVVVEEMKAFVGILMAMGIAKLPRLELYWTKKHSWIQTPGISDIMSKTRFEQIFRFLHLCDNSQEKAIGHPEYCRLFKVKKLLDLVQPRFDQEYNMHQECSIDEAMIPFKGRLGFKQYLKDKPTKWGVKVWVLADAKHGYVKRFQIYTGKNDGERSSVGLCSKVVLDLMVGLETSGLRLFTDNYYSSPVLFNHLYNRGINACGTVRVNRQHFPQDLVTKSSTSNRGFYDYRSNGSLLAVIWIDKRSIYFLSTFHRAEASGSQQPFVKRRKFDGTQENVVCPPLLPDYQEYMRGVDRGDQLHTYYNIGRRSTKWWKRIFFYIVECAILNAYVLDKYINPSEHASLGRKKKDTLGFRLELIASLIGQFSSRKRLGRPRSQIHDQPSRLNLTLGHWPVFSELKARCIVCSAAGQRHETYVQCSLCQVPLCVTRGKDCFKKYHTLTDYAS